MSDETCTTFRVHDGLKNHEAVSDEETGCGNPIPEIHRDKLKRDQPRSSVNCGNCIRRPKK